MITAQTILQCGACRRFFIGDEVVSISVCAGVAAFKEGRLEQFACGRDDCAAVVEQNRAQDAAKQQRRIERRRARLSPPVTRHPPRSSCPPERPLPRRSVVGPDAPSQSQFEASGAAKNQNAILIGFFKDPKTHGNMFPMSYLEEISGAKRMNNRAIDLRKHFEPLGFGVWNEQRQLVEGGPMHSHYGLFPLAEIRRKEQARTEERERLNGQAKLV